MSHVIGRLQAVISRHRSVIVIVLVVSLTSAGTAAAVSYVVLGGTNTSNATTTLKSGLNGAVLQVSNTNSAGGTSARGLGITVPAGRAPIMVNSTAGKATNLDADKLDGLDSSSFSPSGHNHAGQTWVGATGLRVESTGSTATALYGVAHGSAAGVLGNSRFGHGVKAVGNGAGLDGSAIEAEARNGGIALWARTTSRNDSAVVIENNATSGAGADLIRGFSGGSMNFRVTRTGDISQSFAADGLVKAGVVVYCGPRASIVRSFNNVNDGAMTVTSHVASSFTSCTLTLPFDVGSRFAVAQAGNGRHVTSETRGNSIDLQVWEGERTPSEYWVHVLVY